MRYLLFSSFLLAACSASKTSPVVVTTNTCLLVAAPAFKSELYNASVAVSDKHISGLMLFKSLPDSSQHVVFTSETGLTFFNFSWDKSGEFHVRHIIKRLDRNMVIALLRRDLELILVPESYRSRASVLPDGRHAVTRKKETAFFTVSQDCKSLERTEVRHKEKLKTRIVFFPENKNIPDSITIEHLNFTMQLTLSRIDRTHAPE